MKSGFPLLLLLPVASSILGSLHAGEFYLPIERGEVTTPETRSLTADEANRVLERDWLLQAMGEPLLERTEKEISWTRDLARRLLATHPNLDLSAELKELDVFEQRFSDLKTKPASAPPSMGSESTPCWIWYPEGRPSDDAPAGFRFFRHAFNLPAEVRTAELLVSADDACEVFVNGNSVGVHDTWQQAKRFPVDKQLKQGANLLAVRAENRPANGGNPAGLIVRLTLSLADGKKTVIVSNGSWRTENQERQEWQTNGFDDSAWKMAGVLGMLGIGPWGRIGEMGGSESHPQFLYADADPAAKECYFAIRRIKKTIFFKNPVIDFTQLLFIDQPTQGNINEANHEAIHRMGIHAVPGGRLLVLDGLEPGGKVRQLAPDTPGSFWRPDLSFDAQRVVFCYKAQNQKSFHLYEMNFDGSALKQLTSGDYDDIDPLYLPDGHLIFTTTRGNSYVRCGPFIWSYVLARCDADGGNIYLISNNNEPDFVPALLDDGRVIYSRWEYTDKALWRVQSLWTVNPDGSNVTVFWGNQSIWPDHTSQPRQIPGSQRVMFCGVGHHDWWSGSVGIIDRRKGLNFPDGLTKVTRDMMWPESGNGPVDPGESETYHASGKFSGYNSPYPLSEQDFLVSIRGEGGRFRLYLMDVNGNRDLVYEGEHNVLHAIPVKPRRAPPVIPDRVDWPGTGKDRKAAKPGTLYTANVYEGLPDVPAGTAKYLRVFQQDYKTYSTWKKIYRHSGPPVSIVQEETVKRILGEVPIEKDGSVYFKVPAGHALFFQLLDEKHRCLQTMRSFTGVMPGESRGCVGCHEMHSLTPQNPPASFLAIKKPPQDLTPPPWGNESIGFERFVQPVLNQYCGKCHQGEGKARKKLDLTLRPGPNGVPFKEPYLTLVGGAGWGNPAQPGPGYGIADTIPVEQMGSPNGPDSLLTIPPMKYLSYKSRLIEMASSGKHHDVKVDEQSLLRLMAWVDACCPYNGEEEIRAMDDPDFPGIEKLPIRPRVKTAPVVERP